MGGGSSDAANPPLGAANQGILHLGPSIHAAKYIGRPSGTEEFAATTEQYAADSFSRVTALRQFAARFFYFAAYWLIFAA